MQKGLGLYIYQLDDVARQLTPDQLVKLLKDMGAGWISLKVADGESAYNQIGGNDKVIRSYTQPVQEAGIAVGGWAYAYPSPTCKPALESAKISERIEKLDLDFVDFDVEMEWEKPNLGGSIDKLLYTDTSEKYPFGLCSFRFPSLHKALNWPRFLKNETIKYVSPQVYWLKAGNAGEQLRKSYLEYQDLIDSLRAYRNFTGFEYIPIGCAFNDHDWLPTTEQISEFIATAKQLQLKAWAFYSLDWCLNHARLDYLSAMAGHPVSLPKPPAPPLPAYVRTTAVINARSAPNLADSARVGNIDTNEKLKVLAETGDFWKIEVYISKKYTTPVN